MSNKKPTPMLQQYFEIKEKYPDCLLFFRLGDFYELFFEDARKAAHTLGLLLTYRGFYDGKEVPMCGVPFHAYENYLVRLIRNGYKVAICEQMEKPEEAKKRGNTAIVKRDVIRIVTSGTLTEDALLNSRQNNFLTVIVASGAEYGFAWADMSTGEFFTQTATDESFNTLLDRIKPAEIIVADNFMTVHPYLFKSRSEKIETLSFSEFDYKNNKSELCTFFNVPDCTFKHLSKAETVACGVLINYLLQTQKGECPCLLKPHKIEDNTYMEIDSTTRRSLELTTTLNPDSKSTSLLDTIDRTVTGFGARALASQLNTPLLDIDSINARLDKIDYFIQNMTTCERIRSILKGIPDIERAVSRLSVGRGGPRDMISIANGLKCIPMLRNQINTGIIPTSLQSDLQLLGDHSELVAEIFSAIVAEKTPTLARDGKFILPKYNAQLDELRSTRSVAQQKAIQLQSVYIQKTKINTLKVMFNSVAGYFVEVPARQAEPLLINKELGFIHRQTLTNNVRFTTAELADFEQKVLNSTEKCIALEIELFEQLRQKLLAQSESIYTTCAALARIDIATALADYASLNHWVRPTLTDTVEYDVKMGRHPVVEDALKMKNKAFIPNNCYIGEEKERLWILTGPNMAGKSTFLRQNALIVVLAQAGCYVPAEYAKIGIVDKLFSRVGASDDLARGHSTFMVEMVEVSTILNKATERSFVILDEVGRGTATYDGLSIAWAVVEHLHDVNKCRGLFATHYHELTALVNRLNRISLHTLRVREWQGDIVFMHEIDSGAIDRSYGIHVAKLAGLPSSVLIRSEQILNQLEEKRQNQEPLFDDLPLFSHLAQTTSIQKESPAISHLKSLDVDALSPREALDVLYRLKTMAEE